jgi:3-polyprenyl-4-hydroxybenzoate decarboxylase
VPHLQAAASPNPDHICCFVVQDVVSEEWWDIVQTSSIYTVVKRTQITAHLTPYPTTTITSYEYNVQTTNASFPVTAQIGVNPISLFGNGAPLPTQVAQSNNGTALITGGVTV